MSSPNELRARAAELENRVSPVDAGPLPDDERMFLEKAAALRAEADRLDTETLPGTIDTLQQRVSEVLNRGTLTNGAEKETHGSL
ncbi:hypothetical protein [Streptomyces sp. x-80]|uniref:hypothetical protein n=1 Tax=Streptomyces sp. x-80 TaxID=2789282 RepID=UPI00397EBBDD